MKHEKPAYQLNLANEYVPALSDTYADIHRHLQGLVDAFEQLKALRDVREEVIGRANIDPATPLYAEVKAGLSDEWLVPRNIVYALESTEALKTLRAVLQVPPSVRPARDIHAVGIDFAELMRANLKRAIKGLDSRREESIAGKRYAEMLRNQPVPVIVRMGE